MIQGPEHRGSRSISMRPLDRGRPVPGHFMPQNLITGEISGGPQMVKPLADVLEPRPELPASPDALFDLKRKIDEILDAARRGFVKPAVTVSFIVAACDALAPAPIIQPVSPSPSPAESGVTVGIVASPTPKPELSLTPAPSFSVQPSPSETSTSSPSASVEITPPPPTPSPTQAPTPSPTESPRPSIVEVPLSVHEKRRRYWLDGTTKIPEDWLIRMPTAPGEKKRKFGRLNFLGDDTVGDDDPLWTPLVQGVVVDVSRKKGRLVVKLGLEDLNGERMIMEMNYGRLETDQTAYVTRSNGAFSTTLGSDLVSIFKMEQVLNDKIGEPVVVTMYPFISTVLPDMRAQAPLTKQLVYSLFDSTKKANRGAGYLARSYPRTITTDYRKDAPFDPKYIPFGYELRVWPIKK